MSIKTVLTMGTASLLIKSEPVTDFNNNELDRLIQNMQDTMQEEGGAGIAAPQIGCNKRVIMFGFEKNKRYPNEKPVPFTIIINPEYEPLTDEMVDGWEGCLSLPGLRGLVPRYAKVKYKGFNKYGVPVENTVEGFQARLVQHECDHINGILFPFRMNDLRNFGYEQVIFDKIQNIPGFTIM